MDNLVITIDSKQIKLEAPSSCDDMLAARDYRVGDLSQDTTKRDLLAASAVDSHVNDDVDMRRGRRRVWRRKQGNSSTTPNSRRRIARLPETSLDSNRDERVPVGKS